MTAELFEDLEAEVLSVFDEDQIITPDDVRGDADTLEEAVLDRRAGRRSARAGARCMFSLVDTGDAAGHLHRRMPRTCEGRLFFTSSEPGRPDAAFLRIDDSLDERRRSCVERPRPAT